MALSKCRWRAFVAILVTFFPAASLTFASGDDPPGRIGSVTDLGLSSLDVPVSTETKIVYLVNPALNRPADLEALLRAPPSEGPSPDGWTAVPFSEGEIRALVAAGRPGDTSAYGAISDVVEQFFKYTFTQVPITERSLHRLVHEVNRSDFPLAAVDVSPRLLQKTGGSARLVETRVSLRLFMVHVEADRERNLRWVSRSELCFEDSAVGRSPLRSGESPPSGLAASVLDAFRGKIAVSFTHAPALRRPSGKIDEPRRDLIDRSISDVPGAAPAVAASPAEGAGSMVKEPASREDSCGGKR